MNPIELAHEVEERYMCYLNTTFHFKDPILQASFGDALASGHISKGPFLEATPVFKRGQTPRVLFQDLLRSQPAEEFLKAVQGDRPLYQHQEQAIKSVFAGQNVIVATGTGSGKTEAFLYPILLHLYQEFQAGQLCPGVRALILYPMNALANDQRDRLAAPPRPDCPTDTGGILWNLSQLKSPFQFTFGQYIGETPEDESDSKRYAQDHIANRLPGELVLRSEMRKTPPHILLTNYSMLEYLLLRPDDSPLFDNGQAQWWRFLVVDEAHQYRGSHGIEMAMLLRRLKQRLREGGRSEPFQCIATSATLINDEGDKEAVAKFASDLFGEEFGKDTVILGKTETISEPGPYKLQPDDYLLLMEALQKKKTEFENCLGELATKMGVSPPADNDLAKTVALLLQNDSRAATLRRLITGKPYEVKEISDQLFEDLPAEKRVSALSKLVELLLQTKDPSSDAPLLSARYHFFLRSLEGAFVSYWPQKRVFLDRKSVGREYTAFEIALCRECGQHYFVAQKDFNGGKIQEAIRDPSHPNFGATFLRPIESVEDEDEESDSDKAGNKKVFQLCVQCGEMHREKPQCGHDNLIRVVKEESSPDEDKADQMAKCGVCGYTAAGRDPVHEVIHGSDGPNAVIATTLYQNLPETRKKVLAFADGRQEAAFFAWYLENSYKDILSRNLILKVAQQLTPHSQEGFSLQDLAIGLRELFRKKQVFPPSMSDLGLFRKAWLNLYREFLTDEPRISLEGVGLIRWLIKWPHTFEVPMDLINSPWSLTKQEAYDLVYILLDSMRADRAVELRTENGVSLNWSDLGLQASQKRIRIGSPRQSKGAKNQPVQSWDGKTGKRAQFLVKLLIRHSLSKQKALEQAMCVLRIIWEKIKQSDENVSSSYHRLLISVDDARMLNPDWWRLRLINNDDTIFQCDTCGRLQAVSVQGVCPRHRCPGKLKEIRLQNLERNHYRYLYEENLPTSLRVEEHTAQLDKEKARDFQREFKQGKIHVLSCSTTFELGVDLGELDSIFLRNVPPESFNYIQRVGRSGRRSGYPGFAITYCRRSPHDLYHFSNPNLMLKGAIRSPSLSLKNAKIVIRHIAATALSYFFRAYPERFKNVEHLFEDLEHPTGIVAFKEFLHHHKAKLEGSLSTIVPSDILPEVGLNNGEWIERIAGTKNTDSTIMKEEARFSLAEAEVSSDYRGVLELENEAKNNRDYKTAQWAKKRVHTIASEDVLSFLSRKAVIPKYGFPVDVVELDTQRTQQNQETFEVLLQRDLSIAISEFAPTSKLIANKKEWISYGLKKVAEKEWPRKFYKRCSKHNVFLQWEQGQPEPSLPCGDQEDHYNEYIIPSFGFVTNRDEPKEPTSRSAKVFTTRPYFANLLSSKKDKDFLLASKTQIITVTKASPGLMVILCEGRRGEGFYICSECGAGFRKKCKSPHKTPYNQDCGGTLKEVSLGHEFVTDVLQLQFHPKPEGGLGAIQFAFSLAYAIIEGAAEVLEIPSNDLNATVSFNDQFPVPPIILYDNVPGGAGLVARLEEEEVLKDCLKAAQKRVSGSCGCDENTSCYGCLRSYRNQFAHQYLQRGPVMYYLEALLSKWH